VLVLAIDTATAATSVAVVALRPAGGQTLAQRQHVDPRAHGERLAPQISEVLTDAGVAPGRLTAVVAGTGPGPFTGLRVGLVTAAAISQALSIGRYGVCSLDGIGAATTGRALVATDARRQEIYWAIYVDGRRLTPPAVDRPGDLLATFAGHGVGAAYGEGALRYQEVLGLPAADTARYPDPARLAALAAQRVVAGAPSEPLTPLYLRRPDAAAPRPAKPATPR
jgi:tRNA threonylcarbamoyl adenosine modification protein YeaZ